MKLSPHQMLENLHRESCWQTASAAVFFFSAVISYFTWRFWTVVRKQKHEQPG